MQQISLVCPRCGAPLKADGTAKRVVCEYCDSSIFLIPETERTESRNHEQEGYEFEKGRLRAQAEQARQPVVRQPQSGYAQAKPRKRHTFWWIMGWIFIFPVPATILIARSKMHGIWKTLWIFVVWFLYFLIAVSGSGNA